jgi:hypothetical protein
VRNGRQPSYTNSRRRPSTRDRICLRWTTTPGGPCSSSCSARVPCGRTCRCRDRGATPAFPRALNLQRGVGAGKISRSPHPLRSTRHLSAARRNPDLFSAVNPSARRRSPEPQHAAANAVVLLAPVQSLLPSAAAKRNSLPSSHLRCIITAGLRATATTARLWPGWTAIRPPCLDAAPLLRAYQHGAGRLVEYGAHLAIATFGDPAPDIDGIAGLDASRRQAKLCPRASMPEIPTRRKQFATL